MYKHGLRKHPLYAAWKDMKRRCYSQTHHSYRHYGGRGILVTEEWRNDFQTFYDWCAESGYEPGLQLDRIDNNGNYEPSNCRFVNRTQQARNKRSNVTVTAFGETKTLIEWSEDSRCVVDYVTLWKRLFERNWTSEIAITTTKKLSRKGAPNAVHQT